MFPQVRTGVVTLLALALCVPAAASTLPLQTGLNGCATGILLSAAVGLAPPSAAD